MEERIQKVIGRADAVVRRPLSAFGDYAVFGGVEAEVIAEKVRRELGGSIAKVEVVKGFVNITLAREAVTFVVAEADARGVRVGKRNCREREAHHR